MARTKNCKLTELPTKFLRFQDFTSTMRSKKLVKRRQNDAFLLPTFVDIALMRIAYNKIARY